MVKQSRGVARIFATIALAALLRNPAAAASLTIPLAANWALASAARLAFFVRAEVTSGKDGNEILPVTYDNNYVTVFPGETVLIRGQFSNEDLADDKPWLRVEGVNAPRELTPIP